MKKSVVFAAMLLAAAMASAAAVTPGPEPNQRVTFAFAKVDTALGAALATSAPNETAKNVQTSGFMINASLDTFDRKRDDRQRVVTALAPKRLDESKIADSRNPRELHPEGYLKM